MPYGGIETWQDIWEYSLVLSTTVSFVVLSIFRRRVQRSLSVAGPRLAQTSAKGDPSDITETTSRRPILWQVLTEEATRHRSHLARLYIFSGIGFALLLSAIDGILLYGLLDPVAAAMRFAMVATYCSLPLILSIRIIYGRWRPGLALLGIQVFAILIIELLGLPQPSQSFREPTGNAILATVFLGTLLHPRIRAMGTLAAGFFVLVLIGMMLSADWAVAFLWPDIWARVAADHRTSTVLAAYQAIRAQQDSDPSMALGRYLDWLMSAETQSWSEHFLSIILPIAAVGTVVGLGIFILIGWFLFRFIITLYTRKRYTDQMLMILGGWIFFAVAMIPLNTSVSLFVNLAAIATVASLIRFGWRSLPRPQNPCVRLLLLRSFTLGERSDRLFQELASLWRSIGSLQLVGAVDLALSTLEPHEVLDFMRGRSGRQFVHRQAAVDDRLALFDYERDLDGRFRSNVIYCVGDVIWQYTVNRLIENSDCVLMDVRGFTRYRSGCLFEIRCLAKADDCHRITFLVDEVTDRSFLEETWFAAAKTSSVEGTSVVRRLRFVSEQPNDGSISQRIIASYCT